MADHLESGNMFIKRYNNLQAMGVDGDLFLANDIINMVQGRMDMALATAKEYELQGEAPESIQFWKDQACAFDVILHILKN